MTDLPQLGTSVPTYLLSQSLPPASTLSASSSENKRTQMTMDDQRMFGLDF